MLLDISRQETAALAAALEDARRQADDSRLMLQEVDHRAKNSLQLAASMLQLQAAEAHDPQARAQIMAAIRRLQSLAGIHAVLYKSGDSKGVDMACWLERVRDGLAVNPHVQISVQAPSQAWPVPIAGPVGLLMAEALANALKHAFPDGRTGRVEVTLRHLDSDLWRLQISDDGVGGEMSGGLGVRLLHLFAHQLGGELAVERGEHGVGTVLTAIFPGPGAAR